MIVKQFHEHIVLDEEERHVTTVPLEELPRLQFLQHRLGKRMSGILYLLALLGLPSWTLGQANSIQFHCYTHADVHLQQCGHQSGRIGLTAWFAHGPRWKEGGRQGSWVVRQ